MSAAGSLPYLFGIGGFLVDFALAAASVGVTIQCLISSAESLAPTPSSGLVLLPLPPIAWHICHFCPAHTSAPFLASCANAPVARVPAVVNARAVVIRIL